MADPARGTSIQNPYATGTLWADAITVATGPNFLIESGAANGLTATLTTVIAGVKITVATGLRVLVKTRNTLQAGANTFNLNGHGADPIKNVFGTNLNTAVGAGVILDMVFDGTNWCVINGIPPTKWAV